jgi:hypothetical protein
VVGGWAYTGGRIEPELARELVLVGHAYGFTYQQVRDMPLALREIYLAGAEGLMGGSDPGGVTTQSTVPGLSRSEAEFIGAGG